MSEADELRLMARLVRDYDYKEISRMLREAADTIDSLRDRLQPVPAELDYIEDKSNWFELFGTPERAARTFSESAQACYVLRDCDRCPLGADENCMHSEKVDEQKLLEWLRGDA